MTNNSAGRIRRGAVDELVEAVVADAAGCVELGEQVGLVAVSAASGRSMDLPMVPPMSGASKSWIDAGVLVVGELDSDRVVHQAERPVDLVVADERVCDLVEVEVADGDEGGRRRR